MSHAQYEFTWKVRRIFKLLAAMSETYLAPHGITAPERAVLEYLSKWGDASVPTIARLFYVSRQNIQVRINGLQKKGLVETKPNPAHKRSVLITLSEKGSSLFASIQTHEAALISELFTGISDKERQQADTTLTTLTNNLLTKISEDNNDETITSR